MKNFKRRCAKIGFKSGNILAGSLLTLLLREPSYGYLLVDKLKELGIDEALVPYGILYRILREMEMEGLVLSKWEIQESGPSKRIYSITERGKDFLKEWVKSAKENLNMLEKLIEKIEESLNYKGGE